MNNEEKEKWIDQVFDMIYDFWNPKGNEYKVLNGERLVSHPEAAEILGITTKSLYKNHLKKGLKGIRVTETGGVPRIKFSVLMEYKKKLDDQKKD